MKLLLLASVSVAILCDGVHAFMLPPDSRAGGNVAHETECTFFKDEMTSWVKDDDWSVRKCFESDEEKDERSDAWMERHDVAEANTLFAECCHTGKCNACPGVAKNWNEECKMVGCMRYKKTNPGDVKRQCSSKNSKQKNWDKSAWTFSYYDRCDEIGYTCPCDVESQCPPYFPDCTPCEANTAESEVFSEHDLCKCTGEIGGGDGPFAQQKLDGKEMTSYCTKGQVCCNGLCQDDVWSDPGRGASGAGGGIFKLNDNRGKVNGLNECLDEVQDIWYVDVMVNQNDKDTGAKRSPLKCKLDFLGSDGQDRGSENPLEMHRVTFRITPWDLNGWKFINRIKECLKIQCCARAQQAAGLTNSQNTCNGCPQISVPGADQLCPTKDYAEKGTGLNRCKDDSNWCKGMPEEFLFLPRHWTEIDWSVLMDMFTVFIRGSDWWLIYNIYTKLTASGFDYWDCCHNLNGCYKDCEPRNQCADKFKQCWMDACLEQYAIKDDVASKILGLLDKIFQNHDDAKWVAKITKMAALCAKAKANKSPAEARVCMRAITEVAKKTWGKFKGKVLKGFVNKVVDNFLRQARQDYAMSSICEDEETIKNGDWEAPPESHGGGGGGKHGKKKMYFMGRRALQIFQTPGFTTETPVHPACTRYGGQKSGEATCKMNAELAASWMDKGYLGIWNKGGRCHDCVFEAALRDAIEECLEETADDYDLPDYSGGFSWFWSDDTTAQEDCEDNEDKYFSPDGKGFYENPAELHKNRNSRGGQGDLNDGLDELAESCGEGLFDNPGKGWDGDEYDWDIHMSGGTDSQIPGHYSWKEIMQTLAAELGLSQFAVKECTPTSKDESLGHLKKTGKCCEYFGKLVQCIANKI